MTIYDVLTLAIFAGLIVLFLQRSVDPDAPEDHLWQYLVAAVGCAVANYAGNEGYAVGAVVLIIATLAFINYVLRPFPSITFR
ncbi:XrtV sorting system accessory protein [uncultured Sphingomonas sp.]|uniref:XrtV sorting system accessory protein n=1 Tax=uncultured Sphingomonas sp. TaxID=158754 RepID=UPI0035CA2A7B